MSLKAFQCFRKILTSYLYRIYKGFGVIISFDIQANAVNRSLSSFKNENQRETKWINIIHKAKNIQGQWFKLKSYDLKSMLKPPQPQDERRTMWSYHSLRLELKNDFWLPNNLQSYLRFQSKICLLLYAV